MRCIESGLLQEGYNLEFFIEGGRSRTGRLLIPKLGVVKYLFQAHDLGGIKDLTFMPVGIVYDQILEEGEYLQEMHGVKKVRSRLLDTLRNRRLIRQRYGHMYLRFGEPISLKDYLRSQEGKQFENGDLYESLATQVVQSINHRSVVTPVSMVAAALLTRARLGIGHADLVEAFVLFYQYLLDEEAPLAETLDNLTRALEDALELLTRRKLVEREEEDEEEPFYTVEADKRLSLEIYKNHAFHFFLPAAIQAVCLLDQRNDNGQKDQLEASSRFLKNLFRFEFVSDPPELEARHYQSALHFFDRARHFQNGAAAGLRISEKGKHELPHFAGMMANFLEAYWLVLKFLERMTFSAYPEKELFNRMDKFGLRLLKTGDLLRREALNRLLYKNALKFLAEEGIVKRRDLETGLTTWRVDNEAEPRCRELLEQIEPFLKAASKP